MRAMHSLALGADVVAPATAFPGGSPEHSSSIRQAVAANAPAGTALIIGRVLDADTGAPVRGVALWARSVNGVSPVDIVRTNDDGEFVIRKLPGGRWFIAITKSAYVATSRNAGQEIVVNDGERLSDLTLFVTRSAAITGTIVDDRGEPLVGLQVSLLERSQRGPWQPGASATTDDRGVYRFSSIRPGDYVVGVASEFHPGVSTIDEARTIRVTGGREQAGVDFRVASTENRRGLVTARTPPGAVITGCVTDGRGEPLNVTVQVLARRAFTGELVTVPAARPVRVRTDERGVYRVYGLPPGEYYIGVTHGMIGAGTAGHETTPGDVVWARAGTGSDAAYRPPLTVLAPTFHPAATRLVDASPVVVGQGEEHDGIDVMVKLVPGVTVTGAVVTPEGLAPDSPFLALCPTGPHIPADFISGSAGSGTAWSLGGLVTPALTPDGRFTIHSVTPGDYTIDAQGCRRADRGGDASNPGAPVRMRARLGLTVGTRDVPEVVVTLRRERTLASGGGDRT